MGSLSGMSAITSFGDDRYAAAAGLVERSAAAQVSGIPEHPADDGFFGPASVTWRINADLSGAVAGLRSLLMQALHPLAMAGVDQHSDWRRDPVGRLAATTAYVSTVTYGERAVAERAAARVRKIHEHVRGTDTVTGQPYAAGDPALLLWVHAALVDSTLVVSELFGAGLSAGRPGPVRGRDGRRRRAGRRAAGPGAAHRRRAARVPGVGPPRAALHPGRQRVHGLPAQPARPRRGHRRDLARRRGRRGRLAAGLGPRAVRLRQPRRSPTPAAPRSARPSACWTRSTSASRACSRPGSGSPCGCAPLSAHEAAERTKIIPNNLARPARPAPARGPPAGGPQRRRRADRRSQRPPR